MPRLPAVLALLSLTSAYDLGYPSTLRARRLRERLRQPVSEGTFDKLDANDDGSISQAELAGAANQVQAPPLDGPGESARLTRAGALGRSNDDEVGHRAKAIPEVLSKSGEKADEGNAKKEGNDAPPQSIRDSPELVHMHRVEADVPVVETTAQRQTSGCQWCADNDTTCGQPWCANNCQEQCAKLKAQRIFGDAGETRTRPARLHALAKQGGLVSGCQWCSENDKACEQAWCTHNCPKLCGASESA